MHARSRICLWFDREAEEAANFYVDVLRDGAIGRVVRYADPDPTPANRPGEVMTVEFSVEGMDFVALNGGPQFRFNEAISFVIYREEQEELDAVWDALLSGGGTPGPCGWLTDRFGLAWQVTPPMLDQLMASEDPLVARAATEAMLQMQKIEIEQIRAAVDAVSAGASTS